MVLSNIDYQNAGKYDSWTNIQFVALLAGIETKDLNFIRYAGLGKAIIRPLPQHEHTIQTLRIVESWFRVGGTNNHPFWYINKSLLEDIELPTPLLEAIKVKFLKKPDLDSYPALANYTNGLKAPQPDEVKSYHQEAEFLVEKPASRRHTWWKDLCKKYLEENPEIKQQAVAAKIHELCKQIAQIYPKKNIKTPEVTTIKHVLSEVWP